MKKHNKKQSKKILLSSISILSIIAIGTAGFFIYNEFANNNQNNIQSNLDYSKSIISFETNNTSIARAVQLDVGQADSALVQISQDSDFKTTNDNFNIMIDIGVPNQSSNAVKDNLISKVYDTYSVRNIDLMVFTHLHFDHIGAASRFLNSNKFTFNNSTTLYNFLEEQTLGDKLSATAKNLLTDLRGKNIRLEDSNYWANLDNSVMVNFGSNRYFSVLGASGVPSQSTNQNAWSITNRFQWDLKSILYTGDLVGETKSGGIPKTIPDKHISELNSDILKSPHHGSGTEGSNDQAFVGAVSPNEVWISAGNDDSYTLPDVTPLDIYKTNLPGNDVSLIKGTEKFGKDRNTIVLQNPQNVGETDIDYNARINAILAKWSNLNSWVVNNPTVNNNNNGYGDIVYEFKS